MGEQELTVDVVIPAYNAERFIGQTIRSVLRQTCLPARIIVVNDGSVDRTSEVVSQVINENTTPVQIIEIYQSNKGLSASRNVGIRRAEAVWVAFLDADDVWLPTKLERQINIIRNSEWGNLGLVYCAYEIINDEGIRMPEAPVVAIQPAIRGSVFSLITKANYVCSSGSGVLARRSLLLASDGFDENLGAFEDWDMWLRLALICDFDYTPEVVVQIRRHGDNMQGNRAHMSKNELLFYRKWVDRVTDPEVLRVWAYRIASPAFIPEYRRERVRDIQGLFTPCQMRKLFSRTLGSLALYLFIQRWRR